VAAVTALLRVQGVTKSFGAVSALRGVDLQVERGEVHALVGENGAGKSTLMKILSGALAADGGSIEYAGKPFAPADPRQARAAGVAMIYQELSLAPDLSVLANVMLGSEIARYGVLQAAPMRARVRDALELLSHPEITPERRVAELGPGARQLVEVARALVGDAKLLVMDEPTSSLSHADTERLFAIIERLRARQVSIIYISHALEELQRVADRYTVLRDGISVASGALADTTRAQLIEAMVGRPLAELFPARRTAPGETLLELTDVAGRVLPRAASLTLRRGEILGIAGLVGAGRSELLRALFGLEPVARGEIKVAGLVDHGLPPWTRLARGMGLLSEQRKEEGLALELSVADNLTLPALDACSRWGVIDRAAQRALVMRFAERLRIRCDDAQRAVGTLSGGNQQKVALARLLLCDVELLLLDEPTRGVDVGSKTEIYRLLSELAEAGKAILLVSSYLPELFGVCDRLAVMQRGQLGAARRLQDWTQAEVMREATGVA
jgi:ribose transport system ATP-binding protein